MAMINRTIDVRAPVEKVFAYVVDPMATLEWMVSMMEVSDVRGSGIGTRFHWKYKMAGIPFQGEAVRTDEVPNERFVVENEAGIPSTFMWSFTQHDEGTKVDLEIDYTIPVPVLGKLAEKLVLRRNEREADLWMENIKEHLEA